MKIVCKQKALVELLGKGAMAALSDEAQTDTSPLSTLTKSVRLISKDGMLTVESATFLLTTRTSIKASKENGIDIKEDGEIFIPVKDFYDWVKRQPDYNIAISLKKSDTHDIINPLANKDGTVVGGIKRVGQITVISKDESKTGNKASFDSYMDERGENPMSLPDKKFTISQKDLAEGTKNTSIAVLDKDNNHIYNSTSFQSLKDKLYLMTCDTGRAALYEVKDYKDNKLDVNLLVNHKILTSIISLLKDDEDVSFYYDSDANKIFITQGDNITVKLSTADKDKWRNFPSCSVLTSKAYNLLCKVSRVGFANRLTTAALVNSKAALYNFKDGMMTVFAKSVSGKAPSVGKINVSELKEKDFSYVFGVDHIYDYAKLVKDDVVKVFIPEDKAGNMSLKLTTDNEAALSYYVMGQKKDTNKYTDADISDAD